MLAPAPLDPGSGKNSGLISADEVEISSWLPYTAPVGPGVGGGENW